MSFFSEVARKVGLNELNLAGGYNIINYNGEAVYIEGIKRLLCVDAEAVSIELKGAILTLKGQNLNIFELNEAAIIKGRVTLMEFSEVDNKRKGNRDEKKNDKKKRK